MISISKRDITELATNNAVYKSGLKAYQEKLVFDFEYDKGEKTITTKVKSNEIINNVKIFLDVVEDVRDATCDCDQSKKWFGFCNHITASLLYAKEIEEKSKAGIKLYSSLGAEEFLENIYSSRNNSRRTDVKIEYHLEKISGEPGMFLSLKIGAKKLYVVKQLREFLQVLELGTEFEFGMEFSYSPYEHQIIGVDNEIINLLQNIKEQEEVFNQYQWIDKSYNIFHGKKVLLTGENLSRFLEIVDEESIFFKWENEKEKIVEIENKDIDIDTKFSESLQGIVVQIDSNVKKITREGKYLYYGMNIIKQSDEKVKSLPSALITLLGDKQPHLLVGKDLEEEFLSVVIPELKKIGQVSYDERLTTRVRSYDFSAKIYFDKEENKITARVEYQYGKEIIDPMKNQEKKKKLVLRDYYRENQIMEIFERNDFLVFKDHYYLEYDFDIYNFLSEDFHKLYEYAEVYCTQKFRSVKIRDGKSITSSLKYDSGIDFLSFNFSIDGLDREDIPLVVKAKNDNKKFYKLNDGSYLPLEIDAITKFTEISDYLDLNTATLDDGYYHIPKFNAFYLDDKLSQMNINKVKRNLSFKELIIKIKEPQDELHQVPSEVSEVLRDYQITGFNWLKSLSSYGFGGILADDMGLGKTIQMLTYLMSEKNSCQENEEYRSLIVTPTSLIFNWQDEIQRFFPKLKAKVVFGNKTERQKILKELDGVDIVITSYTLVRNDIEDYKNLEFRNCIIDEAQHIKNFNSKTAIAVKELKTKIKFALTGTPIENSIIELWSIFDFVIEGYLKSAANFKKVYENPISKNGDNKKLEELKKMIAPFLLRRLKSDVLTELPEKIEDRIVVALNDEQKKIYVSYLEQAKQEIRTEIAENGFIKSQIKILSILTRLRQICCEPSLFIEDYEGGSGKMDLLEELVDELIEGNHRVLIFSQFTSMLGIIEKKFIEKGINYFYLSGATKASDRQSMINRFNEGEKEVFLISLKAGGTGLNLTGADVVIHFDLWWNPAVEDQATDRAHRIGQKKVVQVMKLITQGTIEEKIYDLQQKKKAIIDDVIKPGETFISKLSEDDLKDLLDID